MKFVMSLVLAATFATPAFASEKEETTVAKKNQTHLSETAKKIQEANKLEAMAERLRQKKSTTLNAEEESGANYRLNQQDPNVAKKSLGGGINIGGWKLSPKAESTRRANMTPREREMEDSTISRVMPQGSKGLTFAGSEDRPTNFGIKLTKKFGGAKQ